MSQTAECDLLHLKAKSFFIENTGFITEPPSCRGASRPSRSALVKYQPLYQKWEVAPLHFDPALGARCSKIDSVVLK